MPTYTGTGSLGDYQPYHVFNGDIAPVAGTLRVLLTTVIPTNAMRYLSEVLGEVVDIGYNRQIPGNAILEISGNSVRLKSDEVSFDTAAGVTITAEWYVLGRQVTNDANSPILQWGRIKSSAGGVSVSDGDSIIIRPDATYGWQDLVASTQS